MVRQDPRLRNRNLIKGFAPASRVVVCHAHAPAGKGAQMPASILAIQPGFFVVVGIVLGAVLLLYSLYYFFFKVK
jgi:hypothetical protein